MSKRLQDGSKRTDTSSGSSTTPAPAPAAGMFGSTAGSKPTSGLFGSSTTGTSAPQTGGLFGTSTTTQPQTGGLFGTTSQPQTGGLFGATSQQPQTGGLFGSSTTSSQPAAGGLFGTAPATAQPAQTGGLFGSTTTTAQPQTGGLFGSTTTSSQPAAGGLFGSSTAQPAQSGGLFGGLNNQNQNKPATSLFGGMQNQQQSQPQQSSMFSSLGQTQTQPQAQPSGLFGGGLSLGQNNNQNQQSVPGVRIDLTNLRGTTRYNDLHEDLQKEISRMDDIIQGQIKLKNDCEAIMPSHDRQLAQIPNDVAFCNRKLVGVESAAVSDVKAISLVRDFIKTDAEHAKMSFRAIDNLKLPPQYHNTGMWSKQDGQSQGDGEDGAEDLVGLFSNTADELAATLTKYQNNITEIEQHLRGVEASSAQQINAFVAKRSGGSSTREDPVAELAAALREFEQSILGVAGKVGSAREGVQTLQLGGFTTSTNARNTNGKRSGVAHRTFCFWFRQPELKGAAKWVLNQVDSSPRLSPSNISFSTSLAKAPYAKTLVLCNFKLIYVGRFMDIFLLIDSMSSLSLADSVEAQASQMNDGFGNLDDLRDALKDFKELAAAGVLQGAPRWEDNGDNYSDTSDSILSGNGREDTPTPPKNAPPHSESENTPVPPDPEPSDSEEDENDLTPLEYARSHGLSRNYLAETLPFDHIKALQDGIREYVSDELLPQFDFGVEPRLDERFSLSKDAARFLQDVAHQDSQETIDALILPMLGSSDVKNARVELPLLKSDHESDCKRFARWDGFEIKLKDVRFPLEMVDEEENESIKFPTAYWKLGDGIMEELKKEKLGISKETLSYLQAALKNVWTREDDEALWQAEMNYKRNAALEPVTPPLFPMSFPPQPYEPSSSSPGFKFELTSDPPSLIKEDLEVIEDIIFKQDVPTPVRNAILNAPVGSPGSSETFTENTTVKLSDIYSPMKFLDHNAPPTLESERFKRDDFKVEGPLTPPNPVFTAAKTVRFSEIIEEMDLDSPSPVNALNSEDFFQEAFGEAAEKAMQQLEQESLVDADTTARVEVRKMETVVTHPPWHTFQQSKSSSELLEKQMKVMRSIPVPLNKRNWAGPFSRAQEKLRHYPFPHDLGKVALEEEFVASDDTWEIFVKAPKDEKIIDSSSMAWKTPGLRILADEDDDDEVELGKFPKDHPKDMSYLVKKRKLELDQSGGGMERAVQDRPTKILGTGIGRVAQLLKQPPKRNPPKPSHFVTAAKQMQVDGLGEPGLLLGREFSAESMLGNFMELRGVKKPKLMDSAYFPTKAATNHPVSLRNPTPVLPSNVADIQLPIRLSPVAKQNPLPAPPITSTEPQNIIISSTLLRHRELIKQLEALLPQLDLVERNFAAHNTTAWMPGSVTRSPITSPLDSEADLIISPSTGVVITTLQRVKQQPLPGSKAKTEIRSRLEKVSARYEKLVVLVTEGKQDETTDGLDELDCKALSEFMGFSAGLVAAATVQFVGGGEETLARWLASIISRHRELHQTGLLDTESYWELFLRRAGMNAFGAQRVVAQLKAPEGVDVTSPNKAGSFGMAAFVDMDKMQRIKMFGPVCGKGVIERVSAVIDARWT
ncbi:Nucleoporin [Lachnellula suecica]|uniref:Nucleoporin n=1 Tax=Lachnellula suecica TaxID=602035 RepID=A0A8T9C243_9HELO|nr:Nucleoporin [Lachnellula suecica]